MDLEKIIVTGLVLLVALAFIIAYYARRLYHLNRKSIGANLLVELGRAETHDKLGLWHQGVNCLGDYLSPSEQKFYKSELLRRWEDIEKRERDDNELREAFQRARVAAENELLLLMSLPAEQQLDRMLELIANDEEDELLTAIDEHASEGEIRWFIGRFRKLMKRHLKRLAACDDPDPVGSYQWLSEIHHRSSGVFGGLISFVGLTKSWDRLVLAYEGDPSEEDLIGYDDAVADAEEVLEKAAGGDALSIGYASLMLQNQEAAIVDIITQEAREQLQGMLASCCADIASAERLVEETV